ncbi:hypothetical protein [Synechococcus sp. RSCCF101]|uniref:hypothetical protein n=1 Tax=Synechococcus sp. RSCCF101 TaxID=2511069 RepID=UPI00177DD547|nr:hypothetical protein [Synechococcus sp. RSCCF101]
MRLLCTRGPGAGPAVVIAGLSVALSALPLQAGPVVCTTSLEAPPSPDPGMAPVEVTTCGPVESSAELMDRRFFTWTAPFSAGVDVLHQITDVLGIALAGPQGNRLVGFGFPDQTIIWDGSAMVNTYEALLEQQSPLVPRRTADIPNGFGASVATEQPFPAQPQPQPAFLEPEPADLPVRGLW